MPRSVLHRLRHLAGALVVTLVTVGGGSVATAAPPAYSPRPALGLIRDECLACHNPEKKKGGLVMSTRETFLQGGEDGPVLVPGKPAQSRLLTLLEAGADPHMPPKKQLEAAQVRLLRDWIAAGAPWEAAALEEEPALPVAFEAPPSGYQPVPTVALSPDARLLAFARGDRLVVTEPAGTNTAPLRAVTVSPAPVEAIAWLPDGQQFATAAFGRVTLRKAESLETVREWTNGLDGRIQALACAPDGRSIAVGVGRPGRPGRVVVLAVAGDAPAATWRAHDDAVLTIQFSPDSRRLVTGGADRTVRVWDAATHAGIATLETGAPQVIGAAFNTNATQVVTAGSDKELKVWDVTSRENVMRLGEHAGAVTGVRWPGAGAEIFAVTDNGSVVRYTNLRAHTGAQSSDSGDERRLASLPDTLLCLDVSADGKLLCAGTHEGDVVVWNQDGKELRRHRPEAVRPPVTQRADRAVTAAPQKTRLAGTNAPPVSGRVVSLAAEPAGLELSVGAPGRGVRITARMADGFEVDVTDAARFQPSARAPFTLTPRGGFVARAAGTGSVQAVVGGRSIAIPVRVTGSATGAEPGTPSFVRDVLPVLARAGCTAGACHAKPEGQNGFKLSVFSYDPRSDYAEIVKDVRGRRVFPAAPEQSLLLLKPLQRVSHEGGRRFEPGSEPHQLLLRWIRAGLPFTATNEAALTSLSVFPSERRYRHGATQRLLVEARYADGTVRDVTDLAAFATSDKEVAQVDEAGRVTAGTRTGEGSVVARYQGLVAAARITVPAERMLPAERYAALPRNNFIDELAITHFQELGLFPSAPCDDGVFLRRVSLDTAGVLPTPEEVREFAAEAARDRGAARARVVERLLARPEFPEYWANQWADLLRPNPDRVGVKSVLLLDEWLRQAFREGWGYDRFVREILLAEGSTHRDGASVIYRDRREPADLTTLFSQLFLGTRLECAKCHHHPNERWSQDDFYQFAAFFGPMRQRGAGVSPPISAGTEVFYFAPGGTVKHPVTKAVLSPRAPDAPAAALPADSDPREALADWLTAPENPFFAKAAVNRVWAVFFGRGLVDPVDDFRISNPCVNPPLLDALAKDFVAHHYDLRHLVRTITSSALYQLGDQPNESNLGDTRNFSRAYRRRLRAEVLLDAVDTATGVPETFHGLPAGSRAIQAWTYKTESQFLDAFSRPNPSSDPPCERDRQLSVVQSLHLMNSKALQAKLASADGRARKLAKGGGTPAEIVTELYLATLNREPRADEQATALRTFDLPDVTRESATEDILWALLNSAEFVFNH